MRVVFAFLLVLISYGLFRLERNVPVASDFNDDDFYGTLPCEQNLPPTLLNLEEYDWVYCSFDLAPLWSALNVVDSRFTNSSSLSEAFSAYGDLDRDGRNDRILRLTLNSDDARAIRFVVLKPWPLRKWKAVTHLDIPNFHLAPEPSVVTNGRGSWLAIEQHEQAWDDELRQENQTWYTLENGRLTEALTFPADIEAGWADAPDLQETVKTRVEIVPFDGAEDRVNVVYDVTLSSKARNDAITVSRRVSFSKKFSSQRFAFDATQSEISEDIYEHIINAALHRPSAQSIVEFCGKGVTR